VEDAVSRFIVDATVTASGQITIEAPDEQTARDLVEQMEPSINFFLEDAETEGFDFGVAVIVDGSEAIKDDDEVPSDKTGKSANP
jgi:hypothetical protein